MTHLRVGLSRRDLLRGGLALAGAGLLAGCAAISPGRRPTGPRRIGFLDSGTNPRAFEVFRDGLRELGWVEGRDVTLELRDSRADPARARDLAAELINLPVDILVAASAPGARAASELSTTIPIVAAGGDVIGAGLVANIAHPERNLTGLTTGSVETVGKWAELLKEAAPSITRLGVALDLGNQAAPAHQRQLQLAADLLGLQLISGDVRDLNALPAVLSAARSNGAEGLLFVPGGVIGGGSDPRIGAAALGSGLPSVGEVRAFAGGGGLLAHGPNTLVLVKRAATFVDKLLKGARPGDLPIELPTTFDIVVNLVTARALGLTIPQSVLLRATEVIQ